MMNCHLHKEQDDYVSVPVRGMRDLYDCKKKIAHTVLIGFRPRQGNEGFVFAHFIGLQDHGPCVSVPVRGMRDLYRKIDDVYDGLNRVSVPVRGMRDLY